MRQEHFSKRLGSCNPAVLSAKLRAVKELAAASAKSRWHVVQHLQRVDGMCMPTDGLQPLHSGHQKPLLVSFATKHVA